MNVLPKFCRYVSANVLGMIGLSCYILADTFFIANAIGADGLTALNIAIPVYNLINAAGLMTGVGGGTRYAILRAQGENDAANGCSAAWRCWPRGRAAPCWLWAH